MLSSQNTEPDQQRRESYYEGLEDENNRLFDDFSKLKREHERIRENLMKVYFEHYGRMWTDDMGPYSVDRNQGSDDANEKYGNTDSNTDDGADDLAGRLSDLKSTNASLRLTIKSLRSKVSRLESDLNQLQAEYDEDKESFRIQLNELTAANYRLSSELSTTKKDLDDANAELRKSARLVRCTRDFYAKNLEIRNAATDDLASARIRFERYVEIRTRNTTRYDGEIMSILDFIFDTYDRYDDRPVEQDCGDGIVVKDVISFMDARDHLNLATILAADPRHLINRYDGGIDQRTAAINAELIYQLSQVFSKQYKFDDLSMSKKIADKLPELMQKIPNALASSATLNPQDSTDKKVEKLYGNVADEYKEKRHSNALGLYSRYQRLEGESHLMKKDEVRAGTMTSIGIILLYNLGNVGDARGIPLKGTYLEKAFNNRQKEGIKLLKQVLTFRDKDGSVYAKKSEVYKWQRRAAYAISKYYYPAGKIERQRNKEARRLNSGKKLKQSQIQRAPVGEIEVKQANPRRFTIVPSLYPYLPVQQNYYRSNGEVGIELDGSGLEGSLQVAYYKPGNGFNYGFDLGYSQQYYRLNNSSIRLPPSSLSFGTAFAGPFLSYAARNIEKEFHPTLTAGLSFRYDVDRKFRLNDNDEFGNRRAILISDLPFLNRTSWYANFGIGVNRERFSLSRQRMIASSFKVFAFVPVFNTAIQVNDSPTAFENQYSRNFIGIGRQTIHLGFTYSKIIDVFKNGLGMNTNEMHFLNNRKRKIRLFQPLVNNNASRKKIDGRFSLMTTLQNKADSVFIPADSSFTNINYSVGWRAAYSIHFLGNNDGFFNQSSGYAWKKFPLYDFNITAGIQQQLYRLSLVEQYRSFSNLHAFAEGGFRFGSNNLMVLLGGGYNFPLASKAIYTEGEGVLNQYHSVYLYGGVQLARFLTVRISTNSLDIDRTGKLFGFKSPSLQLGFGF